MRERVITDYDLQEIVRLAKEILNGDDYYGPLETKIQLIEALAERVNGRL